MNGSLEDANSRRFLWGLLLVWSQFVLVLLPNLLNAFHGISQQRATGTGAIAGAMVEDYANFGFIAGLVFQVTAIIFLLRAFSKEHLARSFVSIISIGCSVLMLLLSGLFGWTAWMGLTHHP